MKTLLSDILDENVPPEGASETVPSVTNPVAAAIDRHRETILRAALSRAIEEQSFSLAQRVLSEITAETNIGLHRWLWTLILSKARYGKPVAISWIRKVSANWMRGQEKLKEFNAVVKDAAADVAESERSK